MNAWDTYVIKTDPYPSIRVQKLGIYAIEAHFIPTDLLVNILQAQYLRDEKELVSVLVDVRRTHHVLHKDTIQGTSGVRVAGQAAKAKWLKDIVNPMYILALEELEARQYAFNNLLSFDPRLGREAVINWFLFCIGWAEGNGE